MGEACSRLSEEERQVIQIEIDNGTSIRGIGLMPDRNTSTASREIRRNTWFPSNENESYQPKRLKTGPWTGGYYIAGPAQRKADRRQAPPRGFRAAHPRQGVDERVVAAPHRCRAGAATVRDPHEPVKHDAIPRHTHTTTITQNLNSVNTP